MNSSCKKCGKLVPVSNYTNLCQACDDKTFDIIKDYLNKNGVQDVGKICRATGIPNTVIRGYLKEGRLQIVYKALEPDVKLCPICGNKVDSEGACSICQDLTIPQLKSQKEQLQNFDLPKNDTQSHGMRFIGR